MVIISIFLPWDLVVLICFWIEIGSIPFVIGYRIWLSRQGYLFANSDDSRKLNLLDIAKIRLPTSKIKILEFAFLPTRFHENFRLFLSSIDEELLKNELLQNTFANEYKFPSNISLKIQEEEKTGNIYVCIINVSKFPFLYDKDIFFDIASLTHEFLINKYSIFKEKSPETQMTDDIGNIETTQTSNEISHVMTTLDQPVSEDGQLITKKSPIKHILHIMRTSLITLTF